MMSDILIVTIVKSIIYSIIFVIIILVFRKELKILMISLSSFKMGNNIFQFKDRAATFEAYSNLSEILLEILSDTSSSIDFDELIPRSGAFKLQKFIKKYISEVPAEEQNPEIMKNVATILYRNESFEEALSIFNNLLSKSPGNYDVLYQKSECLFLRRSEKDLEEVLKIRVALFMRFPEEYRYSCSLAEIYLAVGNVDLALEYYGKAIDSANDEDLENLFSDQDFNSLIKLRPEEYKTLNTKLKKKAKAFSKIDFVE